MASKIAIVPFPGSKLEALSHGIHVAGPLSATAEMTQAMAWGSDAAFARFFETYFNRLLRYLLVISRSDEDAARDALQDTMTRVAKHVRRFDDEQAFWDWLVVLARSAARDAGRKQTRYRKLLSCFFQNSETGAGPAPEIPHSEDRMNEALEAALGSLPEQDRVLIEQKYFLGASVREIARSDS